MIIQSIPDKSGLEFKLRIDSKGEEDYNQFGIYKDDEYEGYVTLMNTERSSVIDVAKIKINDPGKGYGTMVMRVLCQYARANDADYVLIHGLAIDEQNGLTGSDRLGRFMSMGRRFIKEGLINKFSMSDDKGLLNITYEIKKRK